MRRKANTNQSGVCPAREAREVRLPVQRPSGPEVSPLVGPFRTRLPPGRLRTASPETTFFGGKLLPPLWFPGPIHSASNAVPRPSRSRFSSTVSVIIAALVCLAGCRGGAGAPPPDAAQPAGPPPVVGALGRIEPAGGVVNVGGIPGERLERLLVAVGDEVSAGDELARLAGDDLRAADCEAACLQRDQARARIAAQRELAAATLAEAQLGIEQAAAADLEVAAQVARIEATRQNAAVARQELGRLSGLEPRLVPAQALARKRLMVQQAELELQVQETALQRLRATASLGQKSAAARLETARANVAVVEAESSTAALDKAVEAARLRRELALVRAASNGRVIDVGIREGELVGPRPILKIADVSRMQVVAEVYESDVRRIRIGQRAEARSRAIDRVLSGRVVSIGTLIAPNDVQELGMPATTERRVVDVRIDLDDPDAAALVNLQVDVSFLAADEPASAAGGQP